MLAVAFGTGAAVLTTACAPSAPQAPPPVVRDVYVAAPAARVWDALLVSFTDANVPVATMDRASWFLRSSDMLEPNEQADALADCGSSPVTGDLTKTGQIYVAITVLLRPAGDSTGVRIQTAWHRMGPYYTLDPERQVDSPCVSTGKLEATYLGALRTRLGIG